MGLTLDIGRRGRALSGGGAIVFAVAVAGTLDILSAFVFAGIKGVGPVAVLNYVASGPFGDAALHGAGWAAVGLLVHYVLMTAMVAAYMGVAPRVPALLRHPITAGLAYGFVLWVLMYWVVKPLRWPDAPLPNTVYGVANALFSHCILVGVPIALIAARTLRPAR